jgi:hypothetical protein
MLYDNLIKIKHLFIPLNIETSYQFMQHFKHTF